jgi:putative oxidoreductase
VDIFSDAAWTFLRVVIGFNMIGHGGMKLFRWFGGGGIQRMSVNFGNRGIRNPKVNLFLAASGEFFGGMGLMVGFLTPLAAAGFTSSMLGAIFISHWPKYWEFQRGFEYPFMILAGAVLYGALGPGPWSLDALVGMDSVLPNPETYMVAGVVAAAIVTLTMLTRDRSKVVAWQAEQAAAAAAAAQAAQAAPAAAAQQQQQSAPA